MHIHLLAYRCLGDVEKDRVDLSLFMQSNIEAFSVEEYEEDLVYAVSHLNPSLRIIVLKPDLLVPGLRSRKD